jgi:hypothetical protein
MTPRSVLRWMGLTFSAETETGADDGDMMLCGCGEGVRAGM